MTTLTDKRVRSAFARMRDTILQTYERAFRRKEAPEEFWRAFDELDARITKKLEQRPMPELELQQIVTAAANKFAELCTKHR